MDTFARESIGRNDQSAEAGCVIDGMSVHGLTEAEVVSHVEQAALVGEGGVISTVNTDHLRIRHADPALRHALQESDLRVCDGMPLVWLSHLTDTPVPARVTGADLVWSLSAMAARASLTLMLIGAADGVATSAARRLVEAAPGLSIVGCVSPPVGFEQSAAATESLLNEIRQAKPDLVFVALGTPRQEVFIKSVRHEFEGTWWIGVGAALDFVTGKVPRAPKLLQRVGLEWAFRLATDPKRLSKRYIVGDIPYLSKVLVRALWARFTGCSVMRAMRTYRRRE